MSRENLGQNSQLKVKFKKLVDGAVMPKKARPFDAAFDLVAISVSRSDNILAGDVLTYGTGIAVEIPEGHVGLIFPRSSISKVNLSLCNSVGVIDPNYRGEILLKFYTGSVSGYSVGDRIAQLAVIPLPEVEWEEVSELSPSPDDRGTQGFGSSDVKRKEN